MRHSPTIWSMKRRCPDDDVVSDEDEEMGDMGPIEGLPADPLDVEVILDGDVEGIGSEGEDDSDGEDIDDEDDEDDDDGDDDDDDDDDMDDLEELDEITGDENASLADDGEESWSGAEGDFGDGADMMPADLPAGLGFVLDRPQEMLEQLDQIEQIRNLEGDLDDFMEEEMQEDGM